MSKTLTPAQRLAAKKPPRKTNARHGKLQCKLREIRHGLGLTIEQVAMQAGVSSATVSDAENGGDLCLTTAIGLSRFYGMSIHEIWKSKGTTNGKRA